MRYLTVTSEQFRDWFWPAIRSGKAVDESDFETALRLLRKIKHASVVIPHDKTYLELAQKQGVRPYEKRELRPELDSHTFELLEDELKLVQTRLREWAKDGVTFDQLDEFEPFRKHVNEPPKTREAAAPVADAEPAAEPAAEG